MKNLKFSILAAVTIIFVTSCEKDAVPVPVNEEEVITTVVVQFSRAGAVAATFTAKDADGDGPGAVVISQTGALNRSLSYSGTVKFLNELKNPAEDITTEVRAEGDEHQVFYEAPAAFGTFVYTDVDANQKPIGLSFGFVAGTATAAQNLKVTLRHKPFKSAAGVAAGNIANAGGDSDVEVIFPIALAP